MRALGWLGCGSCNCSSCNNEGEGVQLQNGFNDPSAGQPHLADAQGVATPCASLPPTGREDREEHNTQINIQVLRPRLRFARERGPRAGRAATRSHALQGAPRYYFRFRTAATMLDRANVGPVRLGIYGRDRIHPHSAESRAVIPRSDGLEEAVGPASGQRVVDRLIHTICPNIPPQTAITNRWAGGSAHLVFPY